jgi:hypothetical protein
MIAQLETSEPLKVSSVGRAQYILLKALVKLEPSEVSITKSFTLSWRRLVSNPPGPLEERINSLVFDEYTFEPTKLGHADNNTLFSSESRKFPPSLFKDCINVCFRSSSDIESTSIFVFHLFLIRQK